LKNWKIPKKCIPAVPREGPARLLKKRSERKEKAQEFQGKGVQKKNGSQGCEKQEERRGTPVIVLSQFNQGGEKIVDVPPEKGGKKEQQ